MRDQVKQYHLSEKKRSAESARLILFEENIAIVSNGAS
jgi:hypothetical protein